MSTHSEPHREGQGSPEFPTPQDPGNPSTETDPEDLGSQMDSVSEKRIRSHTDKGAVYYEGIVNSHTSKLVQTRCDIDAVVDSVARKAKTESELLAHKEQLSELCNQYKEQSREFIEFLHHAHTAQSKQEVVSQELILSNVVAKVNSMFEQIHYMIKHSQEETKSIPASHTSGKSKSSSVSSILLRQRAKVEATKAALDFAKQEAELKRKEALIEEQAMKAKAEEIRRKSEVQLDIDILNRTRDAVVADAELSAMRESLDEEKRGITPIISLRHHLLVTFCVGRPHPSLESHIWHFYLEIKYRMGKKSKRRNVQAAKANASTTDTRELSKAAKKEVYELIQQLFEKCALPLGAGAKEWEGYLEIHGIIEKIQNIQSGKPSTSKSRQDSMSRFMEWLSVNDVETKNVDIVQYDGYGYGLQATKDLKEAELFLSIPRKIMMTMNTASSSVLGPLTVEDKILQAMPSVTLALHLLCEKYSEESFWKPYIDILPDSYSTPLYFSTDEMKCLKGSPALTDSINQCRNIARQYAYFYKAFMNNPSAAHLPIKDCFTYDDYRWAVCTVMTRQNQIPTSDGNALSFALIPLWDMCNHTNGFITTDFNLEKDCSECYSLVDYAEGDQIFIFYGARSNAELLVNNGFVYPSNEFDRVAMKLGISKDDPLFALKSEVLARVGLLPSRTFYLHIGEDPVSTDLLAFLRIFSMDEREFEIAGLVRSEIFVSKEVEEKVWSFLETRAAILLRSYETTIEEDEEILKNTELSPFVRQVVQLRMCEKKILKTANTFASCQKLSLQEKEENS
ncbi:hypothetical protein ScPMuIL_014395 [Solemya velum]